MWLIAIIGLVVTLLSNIGFLIMGVPGALEPLALLAPEPEPEVPKEQTKFFTFRSREIESLIDELEHQKANLKKQRGELVKIEHVVQAEQKELEQSRRELEALRDKVYRSIIAIDDAEKKNLKELANTYVNMPPETIVEIFNQMEDLFVVKILNFLQADAVAPIFQAMVANSAEPELAIKRVVRLTKLMRLKGEAFE